MITLALDTATLAASVALVVSDGAVFETELTAGETHSRTLLPEINDLLKRAGADVRQIDVIAVGLGPGSFTGLRIGLSSAKGLAWAAKIPLIGISTLRVLADAYPAGHETICPLINARKDQVYAVRYIPGPDGFRHKDAEPQSFTLDRLVGTINKPTIFFGPALAKWESDLRNKLGSLFIRGDSSLDRPKATILAEIGRKRFINGDNGDPALVLPIYVRPPDIRPPKTSLL